MASIKTPVKPGIALPSLSKPSLHEHFKRFQRADVDPAQLRTRIAKFQKGSFRLDLGPGLRWDLELERHSIRAPGYAVRLITPEGIKTVPSTPEQAFKGRIKGNPYSSVRLSMYEGRITGQIDAGDGRLAYVEPLDRFDNTASPTAHAVYFEEDVQPVEATCGLDGADLNASPLPPAAPSSAAPISACMTAEIGLVAENSMLTGYGSVEAIEKKFNEIYLLVDAMYQDPRIGINIKISEIFIEMTASGIFGARDMSPLLNGLNRWAATGFKKPFDGCAIWWYQRGGGVVGLAGLGTICSRSNPGNCIKDFSTTVRLMKIDAAHELGHNWGSGHFNGNTLVMNPSITGTNDQWSEDIISKIVGHKSTRTCLTPCTPVPVLPWAVEPASGKPSVIATQMGGHYLVRGTSAVGGPVEFLLRNATGVETHRISRSVLPGVFSEEIDISTLPRNKYFLEVREGNSLVLKTRIGE